MSMFKFFKGVYHDYTACKKLGQQLQTLPQPHFKTYANTAIKFDADDLSNDEHYQKLKSLESGMYVFLSNGVRFKTMIKNLNSVDLGDDESLNQFRDWLVDHLIQLEPLNQLINNIKVIQQHYFKIDWPNDAIAGTKHLHEVILPKIKDTVTKNLTDAEIKIFNHNYQKLMEDFKELDWAQSYAESRNDVTNPETTDQKDPQTLAIPKLVDDVNHQLFRNLLDLYPQNNDDFQYLDQLETVESIVDFIYLYFAFQGMINIQRYELFQIDLGEKMTDLIELNNTNHIANDELLALLFKHTVKDQSYFNILKRSSDSHYENNEIASDNLLNQADQKCARLVQQAKKPMQNPFDNYPHFFLKSTIQNAVLNQDNHDWQFDNRKKDWQQYNLNRFFRYDDEQIKQNTTNLYNHFTDEQCKVILSGSYVIEKDAFEFKYFFADQVDQVATTNRWLPLINIDHNLKVVLKTYYAHKNHLKIKIKNLDHKFRY